MIRRLLLSVLIAFGAASAFAQGDFVVNYRGLIAGRGLSTDGFVDFYRTDSSYKVRLQGPTGLAASRTFTLPATTGTAGQALRTDGSGVTSWVTYLLPADIGSTVQGYNANLAAIAGLTYGANTCTYWTGAGVAATMSCTAAGRSMIGAADASAQRTLLSLVPGTDVQAYDADLATIAGLTATTDSFLQSKSSAWTTRTPTQVTADLIAFAGDSGSGAAKGLVPAASAGDGAAGKFLKANGAWTVVDTTLTADSTATSGFASPGLLGSSSNLLAAYTLSGTGTEIPTTAGPTFSGTVTIADYLRNSGGSSSFLRLNDSAGTYLQYGATNGLVIGSNSTTLTGPGGILSLGLTASSLTGGAFTVGSASLGSSTVPLTVTLGTGSTANFLNMNNSGGTTLSYFDSTGRYNGPAGTSIATSAFKFNGYNTGFYLQGGGQGFHFYGNGNSIFQASSDTLELRSTGVFAWSSGTNPESAYDTLLKRGGAAATIQMGENVNGPAVNQTFKAHDGITGTNISGANLTIAAGRGTGAGSGGSLIFQTAPVLTTGTTAQTLATALTINKPNSTGDTWAQLGGIKGRVAMFETAVFGSGASSRIEIGETSANRPTIGPGSGTYLQLLSGSTGMLFSNNTTGAFNGLWLNTGQFRIGDATTPTGQLEVSNGASARSILKAYDNTDLMFHIADGGATTIGSSALGSSTVPLTTTLGSGSTANIQNWTNSAGTVLAYISSAGGLGLSSTLALPNATAMTIGGYNALIGNPASNGSWMGGSSGPASGNYNTGFGQDGFYNLAAGAEGNSSFGFHAADSVSTSDYNTFAGYYSGSGVSGSRNTIFGARSSASGPGVTTGSANTIIGAVSGLSTALSNNVILADGDGQQRHRQFAPITLTEVGGAETVLTLTSATTNTFDVIVDYRVTATDGTDRATRGGSVRFVCDNAATVVTCSAPSATDQTNDGRNGGGSQFVSTNSKTLTYAIAIDVATANVAKLTFNIDSDMTVSAASITMTVTINGTVTPS